MVLLMTRDILVGQCQEEPLLEQNGHLQIPNTANAQNEEADKAKTRDLSLLQNGLSLDNTACHGTITQEGKAFILLGTLGELQMPGRFLIDRCSLT